MKDNLIHIGRGFFSIFIFLSVLSVGCSEESNQENAIEKFIIQNGTIVEGNSNNIAEVQVSLQGSLGSELTVPFKIEEGTAVFGKDLNATDGKLIFSPDDLTATIPIEIIGNDHFELSETFTLRLTADGQPVTFTIIISDDDGGYDSSSNMKGLSEGTYSDQFHVYTLVWEKDQISWYVDNQKFKTFSASAVNFYPFNAPFFFIMNVAVGGNWPGPPDETTEFSQEMVVDYIRVFK